MNFVFCFCFRGYQKLWDEVGDNDVQRDKVLFEIEEECLEVYRRKVDEAGKCRSELLREIASLEAEIEDICSVLSEQPVKVSVIRLAKFIFHGTKIELFVLHSG